MVALPLVPWGASPRLDSLLLADGASSMISAALSGSGERARARAQKRGSYGVVALSLDFLVATASEQLLPKPICAIKVDVQGSEFRALRGLNETLHKHRPVLYYEHDWRFVRHPLMHSPTRWLQQTFGYKCVPEKPPPHCDITCTP